MHLVSFDIEAVRNDFPIFEQTTRGKPLVFLDSAASAQKPRPVLDAMWELYTTSYANIHRGVYELSERSTAAFEASREKVRRFIGAADAREIVFVRGTTEAINLVAATFARARVGSGDEVLITHMEHHSNIVPWQLLCDQAGARLRVAPIDDRGALQMDEFEKLITPRTKLAAFAHVSNALGTVNPVRELVELAHREGVPVLVDGAQAVPHQAVDVQELGCDFYAFSSHKLFGPSGVGVLWGRAEHLEAMPPYQSGGEMVLTVSFEKSTWNDIPHKFEAGTPDIAGVVGLGAAIDYLTGLGLDAVTTYERTLLDYATHALEAIPGLRLIGTAPHKAAVLSFALDGVHPHDVGTILDREGIAVRTGHHCAQPVMERFGVPATVRASLALYNRESDVDALVSGLQRVREVFR
ncbi:MAG: cysteine desulfurase [Myxococcota bacterium]|nr:cysteine desulfurase CsdA [Deltaproteobacteria bacterium]MCP4242894.1 cysteine desulfurase [bacterium]MDP6075735.1 cysteine desulfurase [Myxococcota bacterium]MDP6242601.1 cysteine desulfurase [Myxococcota bacterium]MDP7075479.1 cysteine desulfurase [Myxococcota bacterium]